MDQNVQSYPEAGWGETPPAPQKKGSKTILIVVIVLLVLCCCCVLFSALCINGGAIGSPIKWASPSGWCPGCSWLE